MSNRPRRLHSRSATLDNSCSTVDCPGSQGTGGHHPDCRDNIEGATIEEGEPVRMDGGTIIDQESQEWESKNRVRGELEGNRARVNNDEDEALFVGHVNAVNEREASDESDRSYGESETIPIERFKKEWSVRNVQRGKVRHFRRAR